jgi:membrane-bound ClpP family serine protease
MNDPVIIAILFVIASIGLLIADLFLPTGGILIVLSLICAGSSILFAFRHSYDFGIWLMIGELALVPVFAWLFVKIWPLTPLGRRMIIEPAPAEAFTWETRHLVGREGKTLCEMLPTGDIEIDGRRWEATSRSGLIAPGTKVRVIDEEMGQLYVVPADQRSDTPAGAAPSMPNAKAPSMLDRPAKEFGIDSLE